MVVLDQDSAIQAKAMIEINNCTRNVELFDERILRRSAMSDKG
jgi:hypothetical protein